MGNGAKYRAKFIAFTDQVFELMRGNQLGVGDQSEPIAAFAEFFESDAYRFQIIAIAHRFVGFGHLCAGRRAGADQLIHQPSRGGSRVKHSAEAKDANGKEKETIQQLLADPPTHGSLSGFS